MNEEKTPAASAQATEQDAGPLPIFALVFAFLMPPIGLILSVIALSKVKKGHEHHGLVVASTIISSIFSVMWLMFLVIYIALIGFIFNGLLSPNGFLQETIKKEQQHQQIQINTARDVSNDFIQAVKDKDYASAYLMLSKSAQSEIGNIAVFQTSLANKDIKSFRLSDPQKVTEPYANNRYDSDTSYKSYRTDKYNVTGTVIYTDGKSGSITLTLQDTSSDQTSANFVVDNYRISKD